MTARERTTERVRKHMSQRGRGRKTPNSCSPPPPYLCSSLEGVPCDFSDPSLWLTERDPALLCPPPAIPYQRSVPCPSRPSHRHSDARGGEGGWGATSRRDSQWALVSSRPLHLARWDFVSTHRHKRRQMTINGYNNVFKKKFLHLKSRTRDILVVIIRITSLTIHWELRRAVAVRRLAPLSKWHTSR